MQVCLCILNQIIALILNLSVLSGRSASFGQILGLFGTKSVWVTETGFFMCCIKRAFGRRRLCYRLRT